jgi:lipopolysaccharide/colanic/teichoic acid biosynthesis glycosyltransferase
MEDEMSDAWVLGRHRRLLSGTRPWKRPLDLVCLFLALPLLVPLMLLIAAAIKMVSRGPVFYKQERIGYFGRRFTCFKFRTMKVDAATAVHRSYFTNLMRSEVPMTKMDAIDPRLIPLGSLLRSTGFDELPQVFNVLRGEMSLVGPRPCTPYEYEEYLPWQRNRFMALPGLTGLWQVSGKNKTTFTEMIHLDISYARNQSLRLDLKIMLKTIPVLAWQVKELLEKQKRKALHLNGARHPKMEVLTIERSKPEQNGKTNKTLNSAGEICKTR